MNFKSNLKRVISGILSIAMTATILPCFPVSAEDSTEKYPYTMFAASDAEGAITVNAGNFCVNGNIATNGTIVSSGNMNINGTRTEQANEEMLYIFDKIDAEYFTGSNVEEYTEDYTLEEMNININNPVEVEGDATLTGNININSALKAFENVELYGEVKNTNESIICSETGDIIIESQNVNLNGLVYAPNGEVEVTAQNLNLNNIIIIANTITFNCPSVNVNYSSNMASFVSYNASSDTDDKFNDSTIDTAKDFDINDLRDLNMDELYPLEVEFDDNNELLTSISGKFSNITVTNEDEAIYALYNVKSLIGLKNPKEQLILEKVNESKSGKTYTFLQYYNDIEVYGNTVTVSVDTNGVTSSLSSTIIPNEVIESTIDMKPTLNAEECYDLLQLENSNIVLESSELVIYTDESYSSPILAYLLELSDGSGAFLNYFIDANTGAILDEYSDTYYAMTSGSGINENVVNVSFPVNQDDKSADRYILEDTERGIFIYNKQDDEKIVSNNANRWNDPTAISAYTNIITVYDWWDRNFGYVGLDGDGGNTNIYIHFTESPSHNAYYFSTRRERGIRFFDTSGSSISSASFLDVVAHEYTHSVVDTKTSKSFGKKNKSGTINEAYADIFGSFVNNNTWMTYPRDVAQPHNTNNPSSMENDSYFNFFYHSVHKNSTVISHAAYLMYLYGISFDNLHQIWYDSLSEGYDKNSNFNTVRTNVLKAARKNNISYEEISIIKNAFDSVGVYGKKGSVKITVLSGGETVDFAVVTLINYADEKIGYITPAENGTVTVSDLSTGTHTIKVEIIGKGTFYSQVLVKKNRTVNKTIDLTDAMSFDNIWYGNYDHYNYTERYSETLPQHIIFEENSIKMMGYSSDPLKDFIIIPDAVTSISEYKQAFLSFDIQRDSNDWHTMEGGGFLFNTKVTSDNIMSGYCALVTQQGLKLYFIEGIDADLFSDGKLGNLSTVGELLGTYDIGDVLDYHELTLRVSKSKVSLWDGNNTIIDNYELPYDTEGYGFGPITSHTSHACSQISYFTFSNIEMLVTSES